MEGDKGKGYFFLLHPISWKSDANQHRKKLPVAFTRPS
jgi:hypothetical protein